MTLRSPEPIDVDDPSDLHRSLNRQRILRSARRLIAERGLTVSMEEIAEAAGVGRRTLFRYFDGRDTVVAEALESALDWYDAELIDLAGADLSFDTWLRELLARVNRIHLAAGRGLWQLAAADDAELPERFALVNQRRRAARLMATRAIADTSWVRAGGTGQCPQRIVDSFGLLMSSFSTHSTIDLGLDPDIAADRAASILGELVSRSIGTGDADVETATR
jgi:AcrR family transcriptional regulator